MATGFRRSLVRHGGRTIAAVVAIVLAGQGGLDAASSAAGRAATDIGGAVAAQRTSRAPATSGYGHTTRLAVVDAGLQAANLASFDAVAAQTDAAAADAAAAAAAAGDAAIGSAGLQPSIQYEEAVRHAADKIAFTPGARVALGFAPRPGDHWSVGGTTPTALPAGRLDGGAIRVQGTRPAVTRTQLTPDPTIDLPGGSASTASIPATSASFSAGLGAAAATPPSPEAPVTPNGLRREIFGFLPYWEVNSSSLRLDYTKISTIAYFGVGADAAGYLQKKNPDGTPTVGWSGWASTKMSSIISTAHANHTRVVLTVQSFGWNATGLARQKALLASSTARLNLARQIAGAVRDRGADGVNLDFEPLATGAEAGFTALVRTIRAELNRIHAGYQITFDTTGSIGNYPIAAATAAGGADAVFIMGYDYRSAGSSPVGSVAPYSRTGYDIRDTIVAYTAKVPASKLILGVPYYGRAWSTSSSALNAANTSGTKTGDSTTVIYDTAAGYLAQYGRHYDPVEQVAWTAYQRQNCTTSYGCVTSWRQIYIDDAAALAAKYDLVNAYGLRGAGIWALGYDGTRPELWGAIQRKFVTDTTAPVAGINTLPARELNPGFLVTWTGRDDVAVQSYDVQASADGGPWTPWLNATTAPSALWVGLDGHGYAFRVRARDPKGNLSVWNVAASRPSATPSLAVGGFGVVLIDGLSIRSAPTTAATLVGTYGRGNILAIVGGPRTADGFTWFQVVGPLAEWGAVSATRGAAWVATSGAGASMVAPAKPPNGTAIGAAVGGLAFGAAGGASIGTSPTSAGHRSFSPNGDGSLDGLVLDWTNDRAFDTLALRVFRSDGSFAGAVPLPVAAGARRVSWDGRIGGTLLPNGRYLGVVLGKSGGATFYSPVPVFSAAALATFGITIDTVAPVVTATTRTGTLVSPNGDGILDTVGIGMTAPGAWTWTFSAARVSGSTVGGAVTTRSGIGSSPAVSWNGRATAGADVADGVYKLVLTAFDPAGNPVARAWLVRVDTTPAVPALAPTPTRFSPNGDGDSDTIRLAWSTAEPITGYARVYRGTTLVRTWAVSGSVAGAVTWNGTDAAGRAMPDGAYQFKVAGRDPAGNLAGASTSIMVDRTLAAVRWSRSFYPQDGDSLARDANFTFGLSRPATVSLGIYAGSTLIRTVWTNLVIPAGVAGWRWDGRTAAGAFVTPGTYTARMTARTGLGTTTISRDVRVDAFAIGRSASSVAGGQTFTLNLTTIEALRTAPSVTFTQPGRVAVTKTATSLGGGKFRVSFAVATGPAGTAAIRIAAWDSAGGANVSRTSVTIR